MTPPTGTEPDRKHLALLEGVAFRPVFIMGNARSGTTFLYQLLSMTERFNYVTAYHVIKYDELLTHHVNGTTDRAKRELSDRFGRLGIAKSRFDGVGVSPDFPEEYGFALTTGRVLRLGAKTLPRFEELCRKVQLISRSDRPLLLKNPWDYGNFRYVERTYPEARFIFLHRNPARVIRSMLAGMQSLLSSKNAYHALVARFYDGMMESRLQRGFARALFSPRLGVGKRIIGWHVKRTARYFLENVNRLSEAKYVSIRYEDLCRDPEQVVQGILGFLGLESNPDVPYKEFVRAPRTAVDSEPRQRSLLRKLKLKPYLAYCGYDETGRISTRPSEG